jgi:hypothetical protein
MHALIDLRAAVGLAVDTAMKSVGLAGEWEITEAARAGFGANILPDILSVPGQIHGDSAPADSGTVTTGTGSSRSRPWVPVPPLHCVTTHYPRAQDTSIRKNTTRLLGKRGKSSPIPRLKCTDRLRGPWGEFNIR